MCANKYQTIVVDPPWQYGAWGKNSGRGCRGDFSGRKDVIVNLPYPTMSLIDIKNLPVSSIAADNCELYLWVTQLWE